MVAAVVVVVVVVVSVAVVSVVVVVVFVVVVVVVVCVVVCPVALCVVCVARLHASAVKSVHVARGHKKKRGPPAGKPPPLRPARAPRIRTGGPAHKIGPSKHC